MRGLDIAVAGCGPGGLAAALLLHRDGHRVTMFERFDAPRPIGSGLMLQPTGLAVLRELGLEETAIACGAQIRRLFGQAAGGRTVLDVRYGALGGNPARFGVGIHRAALFGVLHVAVVAAGITIETSRTIASSFERGGKRWLNFANGAEAGPFDLVVDMLGSRTPLTNDTGRDLSYGALWATLDWPGDEQFDAHALQQRYRAASVMAGVLPVGKVPESGIAQAAFFWSLRADRLADWRVAGLAAWKADVVALWPETAELLTQIQDGEQLTFARYSHRTLAHPAARGLIHLGDAWHSASPQLGQGANMALLDAWGLALALRRHAEPDKAIAHAVALRRRHVRLYQWLTAAFTPVYQSDSRVLPFVRDRLVGPLSKLWPATRIQAAMVSGLVGNPLAPLGLR